jgi:Pyruvate/2-oxoacid:ferredoxin oxidoreductase delta subunit
MGVGTVREEEIEVLLDGEPVSRERLVRLLGNPEFKVMRDGGKKTLFTLSLDILSRFRSRPHIEPSKCISCGLCADHCPVDGGALSFKNGRTKPPVYDYKKCIGCFCCQEICPRNAIYVGRKPLPRAGKAR